MKRIEEFVDQRQKSWCIHCGCSLEASETNQDHVPTKSLIRKPRPHNLPVVTICRDCNNGFSRDEQYAVTFLSCVLGGSSDPCLQSNPSAERALNQSPALRAVIENSRTEYKTSSGITRVVWQPDMGRIRRVVLKNARGHAYHEYGEPMLDEPSHVWACPLEHLSDAQRQIFEESNDLGGIAGWPEVGSRMLTRMLTGEDIAGDWVIVQEGTYRYSVTQAGILRVRSIWAEYLATEVQWD